MTTITLPQELEERVAKQAAQRGTTVELLALDALMERFALPPLPEELPEGETLADALKDYIGCIDTSDKYPNGSTGSKDVGRIFAKGMVEKHKRGQL